MTEVLNLDKIHKEGPHIVFNGKEHYMQPMSVKGYLRVYNASKDAEKMEKEGEENPERIISMMVDSVTSSFPTLTQEDVESMSLEMIMSVVNFVVSVNSPAEDDKKK